MLMDMRNAEIAEEGSLPKLRKEYAATVKLVDETKQQRTDLLEEITMASANYRERLKKNPKYVDALDEKIDGIVKDMLGK